MHQIAGIRRALVAIDAATGEIDWSVELPGDALGGATVSGATVSLRGKAGKPAVGTWLSLGNVTAARFLARAGFDWLTVDIEHSLVGIESAVHMFAAVADA